MLVFTNRALQAGNGAAVFTRQFQPGAPTLNLAQVQRQGAGFAVHPVPSPLGDDVALQALVPLFRGGKPVLVYLHGFNNTPADCFERCMRLAETYALEVIGFSWPAEGYLSSGEELPSMPAAALAAPDEDKELALQGLRADNRSEGWAKRTRRRFHQAKFNALDSGDALARFLRLVAAARLYANQQRFTFAAHSLGCHFLQYAVELEGAGEALAAAHNVALLAACCRASGHADWLRKLKPKGQTFITYNAADAVLFGASIADGQQTKLGADPGVRVLDPAVRYVSFDNAQLKLGGHVYFVSEAGQKLPKAHRKLFQRIFSSQRDVNVAQGEAPSVVYPLGCDADGSTCYMANPAPTVSNDPAGA